MTSPKSTNNNPRNPYSLLFNMPPDPTFQKKVYTIIPIYSTYPPSRPISLILFRLKLNSRSEPSRMSHPGKRSERAALLPALASVSY